MLANVIYAESGWVRAVECLGGGDMREERYGKDDMDLFDII